MGIGPIKDLLSSIKAYLTVPLIQLCKVFPNDNVLHYRFKFKRYKKERQDHGDKEGK